MSEKSIPTSGDKTLLQFMQDQLENLTVSELQVLIVDGAFLISKKAKEEVLDMLKTLSEKEEDAKSTDENNA